MKIFDLILLNTSILITPILVYLLYSAYIKVQDRKEDKLIFEVIVLLQIYLIIKYSLSFSNFIPILLINVPLLMSNYKKDRLLFLLISIINVFYLYFFYKQYFLIIVAEYFIYQFIKINKYGMYKGITIFWFIKFLFITYYQGFKIEIISEIFMVCIFSLFLFYLLDKAEEILNLHMHFKKIAKEEQIKTSLFKITHEIKNPIAVCKGYLDMYDENKMDRTKEFIPIIKEEIDRVLFLLEDFLSMNSQKINKEILDINFLLEEVIQNMNILFKKNNIQVEENLIDDEVYINGDYNRLTQVLINILKNSTEALENKKNPKIKIWTELEENRILIHIKDNGIGMSKEILKRIKEPFFTTKVKGTGLGVSLSSEIVKAHNGQLHYYSKENKYTEVILILPLEKAI